MMFSLVGLVSTVNARAEKKLIDMIHAFASDTLHRPTANPFSWIKSPIFCDSGENQRRQRRSAQDFCTAS